jgi:hypothetical protein
MAARIVVRAAQKEKTQKGEEEDNSLALSQKGMPGSGK